MLSPTTLLSLLLLLSLFLLVLLHSPSLPPCSPPTISPGTHPWSGDLREVDYSWNSLKLTGHRPPPATLRIAVFSRKWPVASAPGGMERHALTLHSALARRGHHVHVFTSSPPPTERPSSPRSGSPQLHFLSGPPGQWRCDEAWALFQAETQAGGPFDVIHSESVALFHRWARNVPNLVVSWHGISLEALHSGIYQDLARAPDEPMTPAFNHSLAQAIFKVLNEIRFFQSYAHHVAISDSTGEMLRDVYQIPSGRVHVILNGVDEDQFAPDAALGKAFRTEIGLPDGASLVMGVAGRLVKDKGHPLLFEAISKLILRHPNVHLIVAGSGPWAQRYKDLGSNVIALGPVQPAKLKAFYNSLDVFVNPTLRPQGLDLTLMEAMQCGKPIVATRFPSIKGSIVVDEEFGFTFAPNVAALLEVLEKVVEEGAKRLEERGRACRDYAKSMFAAKKMALAYERLFLCIKNETFCKYPLDFD
ncbi:D-inositol 3-phosphate glycosyltransferase [Phoenix dactylifera]|uniref:D-inositol 3-phosphate glycosyltransferase n=1 Tax=Phoenix dactylifera TaxID=42345 RepID=A0A8B7D5R2_PHODC|nr:D-inositol 3-phosphate glycosyltransferase [Phoenix dactylifera]